MKISIITVTKNNKAGLLRAIECVRNQTYQNIEHIIVDGGSTDGTVEVLKHFDMLSAGLAQNDRGSSVILNGMKVLHSAEDSSPEKVRDDSLLNTKYSVLSISEADSGIYDAINKGIKLATGDVIGLLHSDDLYSDENVIANYAKAFERPFDLIQSDILRQAQDDKVDAVYSDLVYVRTVNSEQKSVDSEKILRQAQDDHSTALGASSAQDDKVDAVYSDLVYVRGKSKVKSQRSKVGNRNSEEHTIIQSYNHTSQDFQVIRYWKAHSKTAVNSKQILRQAQDDDKSYSLITNHSLQFGWMPPHPTLFIRKEIFEKYGLYNTDLKIAADYEMILRLLFKQGITSYYLPLTTYLMTIGGMSNKSVNNILLKSKEDLRALQMNGINFPILTLISKNLRKLPQFLARDLS